MQSSDVTKGTTAAASHYNLLRADVITTASLIYGVTGGTATIITAGATPTLEITGDLGYLGAPAMRANALEYHTDNWADYQFRVYSSAAGTWELGVIRFAYSGATWQLKASVDGGGAWKVLAP